MITWNVISAEIPTEGVRVGGAQRVLPFLWLLEETVRESEEFLLEFVLKAGDIDKDTEADVLEGEAQLFEVCSGIRFGKREVDDRNLVEDELALCLLSDGHGECGR